MTLKKRKKNHNKLRTMMSNFGGLHPVFEELWLFFLQEKVRMCLVDIAFYFVCPKFGHLNSFYSAFLENTHSPSFWHLWIYSVRGHFKEILAFCADSDQTALISQIRVYTVWKLKEHMVFVGKGPVLGVTVYLYSLISVFTDNVYP